ncbi:MAG TPA: helix-turn-helix domain-containing protein [Bacteroidia bacterium]|nr:helix-turn-helix domain-containing protein [Bacteroidia bacterium]
METLKYKVITSVKQYNRYCRMLEELVFAEGKKTKEQKDEIALLTLLVGKWDELHRNIAFRQLTPVELLLSLMSDHGMKAKDLARLLGVSKGYVSGILNYKKGLSKEVIRRLAEYFSLSQEAFNRPYTLKSVPGRRLRNSPGLRKRRTAAVL